MDKSLEIRARKLACSILIIILKRSCPVNETAGFEAGPSQKMLLERGGEDGCRFLLESIWELNHKQNLETLVKRISRIRQLRGKTILILLLHFVSKCKRNDLRVDNCVPTIHLEDMERKLYSFNCFNIIFF